MAEAPATKVFKVRSPTGELLHIEATSSAEAITKAQQHDAQQAGNPAKMNANLDELSELSTPGSAASEAVTRKQQVEERARALLRGKGAGGAFAHGVGRGVSIGLGDRAMAAITAPFAAASNAMNGGSFNPLEAYEVNRDALLRASEVQQEQHPIASTAGEITGGVANAVFGGAAANAMRPGVARTVARTVTGALPGTGVAAKVAGGAVTGAVQGGIYGAATAKEGEVLDSGRRGLVGGAVVGGAIPALGSVARGAGKIVDNTLSPYARPGMFAAKKVLQAAEDDQMTGASLMRRMDRGANAGLTAVDVGGDNMRGLLRTAANVPGPQQKRITTKLNLRNLAGNSRWTQRLAGAFGDPDNFDQTVAQTMADAENQAGPLYEAAKQQARASGRVVDIQPVLSVINRSIGAPGEYARMGIKMDSVTQAAENARRKLADMVNSNQLNDLDKLHLVRQDLDRAIESARNQTTGAHTTGSRQLVAIRSALRDVMHAASPALRQADAIWSGEATSREALEAGLAYGSGKGGITADAMRQYSQSDRALFRLGLARGLKDNLDRAVDGADLARRMFGTPARRRTILAAFDDPAERREFVSFVLGEGRKSRTRAAVQGNSTTAKQLAALDDAGTGQAIDAGIDVVTGNFRGAVEKFIKRAGARVGGINRDVASELERLLMSRDPQDIRRARQLLETASRRRSRYGGRIREFEEGFGPALAQQGSEFANRKR